MSTITRYCAFDGAPFEIDRRVTPGRYSSYCPLHPPAKKASEHKPKLVAVPKAPPKVAMDKATVDFVRRTLGDDAANKLERAAKVERFRRVPITNDVLAAADRYLSWVVGMRDYPSMDERNHDRPDFTTVVEATVSSNITAQRIIKGFLDGYKVQRTEPLRYEGVYIICPEGCGKKFLPDAIDTHTRKAHDKHTNYAAQAKEGA